MRAFMTYFMTLILLLPSFSLGQLSTAAEVTAKTAVEFNELVVSSLPQQLESMGVKSVTQGFQKNGDLVYKLLDSDGKIVRLFHIPKSTPEILEASKPSKILASLKAMPKAAGQITLNQLKRFPFEAFTFFIALGAVSTQDLVFNYDKNPSAYDDLLTGQKDPLSQLSFAAFMVGNGLAAQPLASLANSPKMRFFIGSLGMTVGMTASKIVSEIGHFPGLRECALHHDSNSCDKAYAAWIQFKFKDQAINMIPSLVGMIGATLAIGAAQWAGYELLMAAGRLSTAVAVRVVAVNFLISANAAGLSVRAVQVAFWGWQLLELFGFIDTSNYIEVPFTRIWNNAVTLGPKLIDERANLQRAATSGQLNGVNDSLLKFSDLMQKWRENNSMDVLTAHNKWINFLSNLAAEYNVSKRFYSDFLKDVWATKFQPNRADHPDIFASYPLYGILSPKGEAVDPAQYIELQNIIQQDQIQTLNQRAPLIAQDLSTHKAWYDQLPPNERQILSDIRVVFASQDVKKMANALLMINQVTRLAPPNPRLMPVFYSNTLVEYLKGLRKVLGNPYPQLSPGKGYLRALDETYKIEGLINPFTKSSGSVVLPEVTEALILKMEDGFNIHESTLISSSWTGFKSEFHPPKVSRSQNFQLLSQPYPMLADPTYPNDIFNINFAEIPASSDQQIVSKNIYQTLINSDLDPEILGDSRGPRIDAWWTQNVEPQYINAWIDFENKYQTIIKDLYHDLWKNDEEHSNFTGLSDGIVQSTRQEIELYMAVLENFSPHIREYVQSKTKLTQIEVNLETLLLNIKLKVDQGYDNSGALHLVSRISTADIDATSEAYNSELTGFIAHLESLPANATEERKQILQTLNLNLTKAFGELVTYGKIVNAVSYKERYVGGQDSGASCIKTQSGPTTTAQLKGDLSGNLSCRTQ